MKPKNIKEFKALVERYESITLEEIESKWDLPFTYPHEKIACRYTGFGRYYDCSLCVAIKKEAFNSKCRQCVYEGDLNCQNDQNAESYYEIENAMYSTELLSAFRARAEHLRKTYPQYL